MKSILDLRHWTLVIVLVMAILPVRAQNQDKPDEVGTNVGSEIGFHLGRLLPDQINGLTEIISGWGIRYGLKTGRGFIETDAIFCSGEGSMYNSFSVSLRGDIPVESLVAQVFLGLDLNQFSTPTTGQTSYMGGGHVGGGILALISNDVWFRADMRFNVTPGDSLYIGFGFVVRMPEGGQGGAK